MSILTKAGSFLTGSVIGNVSVTGVGFQPKAVVFFTNVVVLAGGNANELRRTFGCATSSTQRWCYSNSLAVNHNYNHAQFHSTRCFSLRDAQLDTEKIGADFVSMDADGFTINMKTEPSEEILYFAIGGTSALARAGTYDLVAGATGLRAVAGVGFAPKAVVLSHSTEQTNDLHDPAGIFQANLGMATSATAMGVTSYRNEFAAGKTVAMAGQFSDKTHAKVSSALDLGLQGKLASMDSGGFTLQFDVGVVTTTRMGYLALGGAANFKVSRIDGPTAISTQTVSGLGFTPRGHFFLSAGKPASAAVHNSIRHSIGAAASSTAQCTVAFHSPHNSSAVLQPTAYGSLGYCLAVSSAADALLAGGTDAEVSFVSNNNDGFTLDWSKTNATAIELLVLSVGESGATVTGVAAVGTVGTTTQSGRASHTLTGTASAAALGTPFYTTQGFTAAAGVGAVMVQATGVVVAVVAATGAVGAVTLGVTGGVIQAATGVVATGTLGTATVDVFGNIIYPISLTVVGAVGSVIATGTTRVWLLDGVEARSELGVLSTVETVVAATGVEAVGRAPRNFIVTKPAFGIITAQQGSQWEKL